MELTRLKEVLLNIHDESGKIIVETLVASLDRMIDIGLPYLSLNREACSLSGGEAQRLKLVRYMGNSLTGMTYIFDEPSTGMHPRDVHRMSRILLNLRDNAWQLPMLIFILQMVQLLFRDLMILRTKKLLKY